jgi:hypothetical protein
MDIRKRRESLKEELAKGEEILADLDARRRDARDRMLRISGAIQVLDELLNDTAQLPPDRVPNHVGQPHTNGTYAHAGD